MQEYPETRRRPVAAGMAVMALSSLAIAALVDNPLSIGHKQNVTHQATENSNGKRDFNDCFDKSLILKSGSYCLKLVRPSANSDTSSFAIEFPTKTPAPTTTEAVRVQIASETPQQPIASTTAIVSPTYAAGSKEAEMQAAGISASDYRAVEFIFGKESGWCPTKWQNETYCPSTFEPLYSINSQVGYGGGQSTPASNMAPFGSDWQTNIVTQLRWANSYASSRYGGWWGAYNYWTTHNNW